MPKTKKKAFGPKTVLATDEQYVARYWAAPATAVVSTVLFIVSLMLAWRWKDFKIDTPLYPSTWPGEKLWEVAILIFWSLAPPIAFWYDYYFIWRRQDPATRTDFDEYKYGIDVSSKIWIALVSALLVLYFGKDLGFKQ